jgi:hypothetical protein
VHKSGKDAEKLERRIRRIDRPAASPLALIHRSRDMIAATWLVRW